jgi:UPF0755 protein
MIEKKSWIRLTVSVLLCSCAILAAILYFLTGPTGITGINGVEIRKCSTAREIAELLKEKGLLRSTALFSLYSKVKGYDRTFKAGTHPLDGTMSMSEIALLLTMNPPLPPDRKVTIVEGLTVREIASVLAAEAGVDSAGFVEHAMNRDEAQQFGIDNETLEGYLFPDTYYVKVNSSPLEIIGRMTGRFQTVFNDSLKARAKKLGMTEKEAVILASIIECEAACDNERPFVSQVFHRRLKLKLPLAANPTIQYAIGCKRRLLDEDLTLASPYNTYIHRGLPPGPVSNPGGKSLRAALYPADTSYLYFVADGKGRHVFSRTFSEHTKAVQQYKRQRKKSSIR